MHKQIAIYPFLVFITAVAVIASACSGKSGTETNVATSESALRANQNSGIEVEIVTSQPIESAITATGKVLVPEDRTATIGPVHEGRILRLYAGQGTLVRKGQRLADLESADIGEAEADYLKALAELENANRSSAAEIKFAKATYDRTKLLYEREITPAKNMQQAEHDLDLAKANADNAISSAKVSVSNARRHLLILGVTESAIDSMASKQALGTSVFPLFAPITGVVVERNANIGATVGTDATLFKINDLSRVWIDANVFEKDLSRVYVGQAVKITAAAFPQQPVYGKITFIASGVDPETRTVNVRTDVPNSDGRLKPDMFVNVEIIAASRTSALSLPLSAVLDDGGKSIVFVSDGNEYKKREVTVGLKSDDRIEITSGLNPGDKVVIKGNYLLMQQSQEPQ